MRIQTMLVLCLIAAAPVLAQDGRPAMPANAEAPVQSAPMVQMGMTVSDGNSEAEAQFQALKQQVETQQAQIEQLKSALQELQEKEAFDLKNTKDQLSYAATLLFNHYHTLDGKDTSKFVSGENK